MKNKDAYMSLIKAVMEASYELEVNVEIKYIDVMLNLGNLFEDHYDGILVPGGFGPRGFDAKVEVAKYARVNKIPFLGICYGFQAAVVEYAQAHIEPLAMT